MTTKEAIVVEAPLVESFLDCKKAKAIWPEEISNHPEFLEQIIQRKKLHDSYCRIAEKINQADMTLSSAIELSLATENQVSDFFNNFAKLLKDSKDYHRIILYFPFEFLPTKDWQPSCDKLKKAKDLFAETFREVWYGLLEIYDVRANFVDGDVLEKEYRHGDHPRVVKAAHLVPKLIENGILNIEDIFQLILESDDMILRNSLADSLSILADMGFIREKELVFMINSENRLLSNMARIIEANGLISKKNNSQEIKSLSHSAIINNLRVDLSRIDSKDFGKITDKRKKWLKERDEKSIIEKHAKIWSEIISDEKSLTEAITILEAETSSKIKVAFIEAIRIIIEKVITKDFSQAKLLYISSSDYLRKMWDENEIDVDKILTKTFRYFFQFGLMKKSELQKLGITFPNLDGNFSKNLKFIEGEINNLKIILEAIKKDPELSQMIFPTFLVYGSRLKGYGEKKSDIDIGIFIRPETPFSERSKLQKKLNNLFIHHQSEQEFVEFWLEENNSLFKIRRNKTDDINLGDNLQAHILLGGAWVGDKKSRDDIINRFLQSFLIKSEEKINGRLIKDIWIEELERDTLLYRLLHKGHERFFPKCGGINSPSTEEIDGNSRFYDSGYRRLATKLFLKRVFIPQVSK